MTMESEALKEINELKAQVNALRDGVTWFNRSGGDLNKLLTAYTDTPAQCLKQHDIELLKSIEKEYANGPDIDFCDFFSCYRVNLELDNE